MCLLDMREARAGIMCLLDRADANTVPKDTLIGNLPVGAEVTVRC